MEFLHKYHFRFLMYDSLKTTKKVILYIYIFIKKIVTHDIIIYIALKSSVFTKLIR